jgi:hypothetical protein
MEGRVLGIAVGTMSAIDLQAPRQRRRPAEELLVEVVPDPPDRLGDKQARCGGVEESRDVRPAPVKDPDPGGRAGRDPAPDAQAAVPDGERPPPAVRGLIPARDQEVEATADETRREPPQRHFAHELAVATLPLPAALDDRHGHDHRHHVTEAIDVYEQGAEVDAVPARAWDERERQRLRDLRTHADRAILRRGTLRSDTQSFGEWAVLGSNQ